MNVQQKDTQPKAEDDGKYQDAPTDSPDIPVLEIAGGSQESSIMSQNDLGVSQEEVTNLQENPPQADPFTKLERILLGIAENQILMKTELKVDISKMETTMENCMENTEKSLADQITLTNRNLSQAILEQARDFNQEVLRINKRLDERDGKTMSLIQEALAERDALWEARLVNIERKTNNKEIQELTS